MIIILMNHYLDRDIKELVYLLSNSDEQRDELFSIDGFDIVESHYFPLIRFLIVDGLLDETYWYYKGNFNIDKSNILKRNDTIYVKGLKLLTIITCMFFRTINLD